LSTKLLVRGGVAVTMDGKRRVVHGAGVAVQDDRITAVGPPTMFRRASARTRWSTRGDASSCPG